MTLKEGRALQNLVSIFNRNQLVGNTSWEERDPESEVAGKVFVMAFEKTREQGVREGLVIACDRSGGQLTTELGNSSLTLMRQGTLGFCYFSGEQISSK